MVARHIIQCYTYFCQFLILLMVDFYIFVVMEYYLKIKMGLLSNVTLGAFFMSYNRQVNVSTISITKKYVKYSDINYVMTSFSSLLILIISSLNGFSDRILYNSPSILRHPHAHLPYCLSLYINDQV